MTEREAYYKFDEYLDETYPEYNMGQLTFFPSDILKDLDPIAYEESFKDWVDNNNIELED